MAREPAAGLPVPPSSFLHPPSPAKSASNSLFAEVAVNSTFPHRQTFSYVVPQGLDVLPGHAVYVPFGRLTLQGIVVEVHDTPVFAEPEKIRPVRSLIGSAPLLDPDRVALARWIAHTYLAHIFESVALMLPPGFERRPVTIVRPLVARDSAPVDLTARQRAVLDAVLDHQHADLDTLRAQVGFAAVEPVLAQLERLGLVAREYTLARPHIAPKTVAVASLIVPLDDALRRVDAAEPPKRSRRAAVLERLLIKRAIGDEEAIRLAGSRANLERIVRAGAVRPDRDGHNIELALSEAEAAEEIRALTRTQRAQQATAVASHLATHGAEPLPALRDALRVDAQTIRWLGEIGAVALREEPVERDPLRDLEVRPRPPATLLPAQSAAAAAICAALDARRHETFLLHGVTGSGKTEVYLHALERCIAVGRRAIVMVPEIALTPQTVRRFRERFERVAVLHSGLGGGEMFDQWNGIAAGRYDVVIGSRSAIFAPQPDLGLVVIDEEHEWTYKQSDPQPRYHARDVAIELARMKGAAVVLGSATPDVMSYHRAKRGLYTLLDLPKRIRPIATPAGASTLEASIAMPRIDVIDLREELHSGNRSMFSRELTLGIREALDAHEQVILFLNRRGLAGHVQCRDCGFVPRCHGCDVALTYHRQVDRLVCHQCNRPSRLPLACKQCGSPRVRLLGAGVEKVEAEAARAFPQARLLRWDRDVTRGKGAHERILAGFLAHEADILIGTQMVAKGLDMPAVTLVGVVNADTALHLPDFRAGERTFQLLTQVAGRAGRGLRDGRVIIQTYTPDHYAIDTASRYDYEAFAAAELRSRVAHAYPPFGRLLRLALTHVNPRAARDEAHRLHRVLTSRRAEQGSDTELIGPSEAYVRRLRGRWRWHIVLRGRDPAALLRGFVLPPNVAVDVDPASML